MLKYERGLVDRDGVSVSRGHYFSRYTSLEMVGKNSFPGGSRVFGSNNENGYRNGGRGNFQNDRNNSDHSGDDSGKFRRNFGNDRKDDDRNISLFFHSSCRNGNGSQDRNPLLIS